MYEILSWDVSAFGDNLLKVVAKVRCPEGIFYDSKFECVFEDGTLLFSIPLSYYDSIGAKPTVIIDEEVHHEIQHVVTKWVYKLCDARLVTYRDLEEFRPVVEEEVGEIAGHCLDCFEGKARKMKLDDRVEQLSYKGNEAHYIPVPNDMELAHCEKCFATYLNCLEHKELDKVLKELFEKRDLNHKDSATLTLSLKTNVYDKRHKRNAGRTAVIHLDLENMELGEISSGRHGYDDASILSIAMYEMSENLKKHFRTAIKNTIHHEDEMQIEGLEGYVQGLIEREK